MELQRTCLFLLFCFETQHTHSYHSADWKWPNKVSTFWRKLWRTLTLFSITFFAKVTDGNLLKSDQGNWSQNSTQQPTIPYFSNQRKCSQEGKSCAMCLHSLIIMFTTWSISATEVEGRYWRRRRRPGIRWLSQIDARGWSVCPFCNGEIHSNSAPINLNAVAPVFGLAET